MTTTVTMWDWDDIYNTVKKKLRDFFHFEVEVDYYGFNTDDELQMFIGYPDTPEFADRLNYFYELYDFDNEFKVDMVVPGLMIMRLLAEDIYKREHILPCCYSSIEEGVFFFADLICKDLPHEKESRLHTIVIDTETTGLDCFKDELLQVSIVSGTGVVLYDSYVKPEVHAEWPMASKINGITPEMVAHAPSIEDVAISVGSIVDHAHTVVGYNTPFDLSFLHNCLYIDFFDKEVRDVLPAFAEYMKSKGLSDKPRHKLTTCAEHFGYEWAGNAHNSAADALATLFCDNCLNRKEKNK